MRKMKKFLAILLAVVMVLSLVACGDKGKAEKYCWSCGEGISKKDSFCEYCGASVKDTGGESENENIPTSTTSENSAITTAKPNASKPSSNATIQNTTTRKVSSTTKTPSTNKPYTTTTTKAKEIPVETILFDKVTLSMMAGDTEMLGVTIYPYNATNPIIYWESSDNNIVSVDSLGNLTAISYGNAVISAHTSNGVYAVDCQVMVKSNPILTCRDFPLHLYSYDGKDYLGKLVTNEYDSDSIWNEYGTYGSKYQTKSIWNEYGAYGSQYQTTSAFNPYASKPPQIVTNSGTVIGYLTANEFRPNSYTIIQLERALKKVGQ